MWVVMLPGEYPEGSDLFGPFRSELRAQEAASRWNAAHPAIDWEDSRAAVLPLHRVSQLED